VPHPGQAALVDGLKGEVTDVRNRNIQYTILQREVDTNRSLYEGLLQRYKEIGVAGGVGVNNVSIVDKAQVPGRPYTPRLSLNVAFALMLGLMLGGAAAFVREHFDDTFKSPEDVEDNLGLPLLGIIPLVKQLGTPAELVEEQQTALAEAYRSLRTALQFSTADGVPKSLLVTSSRAGEGKSTSALMLAANFARLGMRVLLIDADLRRPSLHESLKIDPTVGLTNVLTGTTVSPEAFRKSEIAGVTVMGSGPLPPNPAELLASPKMLSLLTIAAQEYDLVIIDGPPVAGLADAPMLASMAMGTLLIIDANGTRKGIARAALKRLHLARAQVIGAAVNKLDLASVSYGFGYGYGYGYGDAGYYGPTQTSKLSQARKLIKRK
jgi:polysaccharide biosynthesis transport protein